MYSIVLKGQYQGEHIKKRQALYQGVLSALLSSSSSSSSQPAIAGREGRLKDFFYFKKKTDRHPPNLNTVIKKAPYSQEMTGRMHFSARANWMMFTKEERRNIAIYILGISMFSQIYLLLEFGVGKVGGAGG